MIALFTTTTACDCGDVASVGLGEPLCATTAIPAITATIVNAASIQTPQVSPEASGSAGRAGCHGAGTLPNVVRQTLQKGPPGRAFRSDARSPVSRSRAGRVFAEVEVDDSNRSMGASEGPGATVEALLDEERTRTLVVLVPFRVQVTSAGSEHAGAFDDFDAVR